MLATYAIPALSRPTRAHRQPLPGLRRHLRHGVPRHESTLMVTAGAIRCSPTKRERARRGAQQANGDMNVPHWKNFLECIRTARQPSPTSRPACAPRPPACSPTSPAPWRDPGLGRAGVHRQAAGTKQYLRRVPFTPGNWRFDRYEMVTVYAPLCWPPWHWRARKALRGNGSRSSRRMTRRAKSFWH